MKITQRVTKTMVQSIVILALGGYASVSAGATKAQETDWRRYTASNEEFSVLLPELPAMSTSDQYLEVIGKHRRIRQFAAYHDDVVYVVHSYENLLNQSLEDFVRSSGLIDLTRFQIKSAKDLSMDSFKGKEIVAASTSSAAVFQFWKTNKHLYVLKSISPVEGSTSPAKFFSSLLLGSKQTGEDVQNGPGGQADGGSRSNQKEQPNSESPAPESDDVFSSKLVSRKMILGSKPEPSYTDEARRNQVTGTVMLKAVFASNGQVRSIQVVKGLPNGLTEGAILAARQIRFIPAVKDGKRVSIWIQLEYNFNLY